MRLTDGIYAVRSGDGDIKITSRGAISANRAVYALHDGEGDIDIDQFLRIDASDGGIEAEHTGEGNIEITMSGVASITTEGADSRASAGDGIDAEHTGEGNIEITMSEGTNITAGGADNFASVGDGIDAGHTGEGNIEITVSGRANINAGDIDSRTRAGDGIKGHHKDNGIVDIDVLSGGSITGWHGIFIKHEGTYATNANNNTYSVHLDIDGKAEGHKKGVIVEHSGTGDVVIEVGSAGSVISRWYEGIKVNHLGTGKIKIDVSGEVSGGPDAGPITVAGGGDKTLILRPGFSLNGNVISMGSGKGFLELAGRKLGSTSASSNGASNTVNLGNIYGFKKFVKADRSAWTVTGNSHSVFESAAVAAGTLRFSSVKFRMASGGEDFAVRRGSILEIAGANTLYGNLNNAGTGEIHFLADGNSTLNVTGNYKGRGKLIFDVGTNATEWKAQQLLIDGNVSGAGLKRIVEIRHSGGTALGETFSGWLIESDGTSNKKNYFKAKEASGKENAERGATEQNIGGNIYDFVHEYDSLNDKNRWGFRWREVAQTPVSDMPRIPPPPRDPEGSGGNGQSENLSNSFVSWADDRDHEGGLWAEQRSSRTLLKSSTGGLLRKEGDHVHFGFDLPAQRFMGGDVALGAGVLQEISMSDVSSSTVEGSIGIESHSASLRASWQSPFGFYVDGQTWYTRFSSDISMEGRSLIQDNEGTSMSATAELGYHFTFPLGRMNFGVVPQMQLIWSSVGFDNFVGSRGESVSLEDGELMTGRLGLSWDGEWHDVGGSGRVYGGMNLRDALDGRTAVNISGASLVSKQNDLSVDGRLGVSYEWDDGYSIYGEAKASREGDVEEVRANLGASIEFEGRVIYMGGFFDNLGFRLL